MIENKNIVKHLEENSDYSDDAKLYLLFLYNSLKSKQPSEELNNKTLEKLVKVIPMGEWYRYCLSSVGTTDFFTRLLKITYETSHHNILTVLKRYAELESEAMEQEHNKIYLLDFLTDNLNSTDYDVETRNGLMQLYDFILNGIIRYPEDMQNYGLIM